MVKWNENEVLAHLATRTPDWQGRLSYKGPKYSGAFNLQQVPFKERYLRLYGNILICLKADRLEHTNLFILENFSVQVEDKDIFSFSITFQVAEGLEKHMFVAVNLLEMNQWIDVLFQASYEKLRLELILLQIKIRSKTGEDPLVGTNLEGNPIYSLSEREATAPSTPKQSHKCSCTGGKASQTTSNFTSHLGIQVWENNTSKPQEKCANCDKSVGKSTPTFRSHLKEVEPDLIKF